MTAINMTKYLKPQGLDKDTWYPGKVVNNNDPEKLGRIQVRVDGIQDDVEDEFLPWAIPNFNHVDGAKGAALDLGGVQEGLGYAQQAAGLYQQLTGSETAAVAQEGLGYAQEGAAAMQQQTSGTFFVPKVDSMVSIKFQDGDHYHPVWGGYTVDDSTRLKEIDTNYPDRAVLKFLNGTYIIVDSKTNEVFLNCPGDMHLSVMGNLNQVVLGDSQEIVTSDAADLPSRFTDSTSLANYAAHALGMVPFQGLGSRGGSKHHTVKGDYSMTVKGNRKVVIEGNDDLVVQGNRRVVIEGTDQLTVGGSWTVSVGAAGTVSVGGALVITGTTIDLN